MDSLRGSESAYRRHISGLMLSGKREFIHVWRDSEIIGQIEFSFDSQLPELGYINLFYLKKEYRGTGISRAMHEYAINRLAGAACRGALLSVSKTNARA